MQRRTALRPWVPVGTEDLIADTCDQLGDTPTGFVSAIATAIAANRTTHDVDCVNLNPATNTMHPSAVAVMDAAASSRPSLGYPGDKYEMGLEAIEQVEIIAAELAARVFNADFAEVRVPSGAIANLYAFMATAEPGDSVIVPPATIAGHVTHHSPGAAGLFGLDIHEAPIDTDRYTLDIDGLGDLATQVRPRLITIGCSLNLAVHDVAAVRSIADACGAKVLFDAAHLSGVIAGGAWPDPLQAGAHMMTMSAYKSLAGPAGGLVVTNDAELAERVDKIAFPGLTANFDAGKTAALGVTLARWLDDGPQRALRMVECAQRLAAELADRGVAVFTLPDGSATASHAFALDARAHDGGTALAKHLRRAGLLASAIGLPTGLDDGLRLGTNELVELGADPADMPALADLVAAAVASTSPQDLAPAAAEFRRRFRSPE